MSRSRSHIRRQTAATQATIDVLRAPVARSNRRRSFSPLARPWAAVVAVSVVLGLLASWIALASVGWLPQVPPGPWAPRVAHVAHVTHVAHVAHVAPMHHQVPQCYAVRLGVWIRVSRRDTRLDTKQVGVARFAAR
jgi:hypothetical protein